ncbi:TetR/AcrR family transcriptional regulator [Lacihabitans sp. CCS-44]|uniref:TetR/AcrR family transcriptional regulator n=1 Tax=Lacihabitans sp. CCS-44 TaxID=2487331 RepID=UPI0020CC740A|nr:TetR/AcrR family transcriptional regulator [Lacihabitans sp. CCS-44]MCP9755503.1 TetR/AcrR family transcriptional regulator [Lacihabitans sp. CCS-44]
MSKAAATRLNILHKAFELIYAKGYQTTSIDEIIATTKVTKGAFFYHFKSKDEMGLAIINEILKPTMEESFIKPLENATEPIGVIYQMMYDLLFNNEFLKLEYGCPAGNLTQEMTPWNVEFSEVLSSLTRKWHSTLEKLIEIGKKNGNIRPNVNAAQVAYFVMSGYWGIRNFGKVYKSKDCYFAYLEELKVYLDGLK